MTETMIRVSAQASVLLLLVLFVTLFFRKWLSSRVRFWLWGLVLLRFLIPFAPPSNFSIFGIFTVSPPVAVVQVQQMPDEPVVSPANYALPQMMPHRLPNGWMRDLPERETAVESVHREEVEMIQIVRSEAGNDIIAPQEELQMAKVFPWKTYAAWLWLAGVVVLGLDLVRRELLLLRRQWHWEIVPQMVAGNGASRSDRIGCGAIRSLHFVMFPAAIDALRVAVGEIRKQLKLRRRVRVYLTSEPVGAASCGVLRPKIILSRDCLKSFSPEEIRLILFHEMLHHKRLDPLTHWLSLVVRVLHWPNPLAWLLAARLRTERELAVDEAVVCCTGIAAAPDYGSVILKTVWHYSTIHPAPGLLGIQSQDKFEKFLERRITMILQPKPSNLLRATFGILLVALLAVTGLTDAKPAIGARSVNKEQKTATEAQETVAGSESDRLENDRLQNDTNVVIRGRVVDEDGNPVAGISVYDDRAYLRSQPPVIVKTDEDGWFQFEMKSKNVNPWTTLYAVTDDQTKFGGSSIGLRDGDTTIPEMNIKLMRARVITGTVVDQDDQPVEGAVVAGVDGMSPLMLTATTDADGRFRLVFSYHRRSLLQQIYAFKEGVGFNFITSSEMDTYRRGMIQGIDGDGPFPLKLAPFEPVEIKVVNEEGEPIPGTRVAAWLISKFGAELNTAFTPDLFSTSTNAEGMATLRCLPEWAIHQTQFTVSGGNILRDDGTRIYYGGNSLQKSGKYDEHGVLTFTLPRAARVLGTVKLPDGTPVSWAMISCGYSRGGHGIRFADADGEFEIRNNINEKLYIAVDQSKLGAAPGVFGFDVGDGTTEKRLDFVLERGIRLYGTVYDRDGKPAAEGHISIHESDPDNTESSDNGIWAREVFRQTNVAGGKEEPGKYEYLLPAAKRSYRISASVIGPARRTYEMTLNGDEEEYHLDLYMENHDM